MCIPVDPEVLQKPSTPIASSTFFVVCATCITCSKVLVSLGSRSIRHQSGLSGFLRVLLHGCISMPLHWEEVKKGLKLKDYTIKNAVERVKREGDIFKGVLTNGIDLGKVLKQLV